MSKHTIQLVVGDRDTWSFRIYDDGRDNDLASATVTIDMWDSNDTQVITAGAMTAMPGITFTAATTDKLTAAAHGLQDGWEVVLSTTGTLPAGLATSTRYFVRDRTPNTLKLSLEPNGTVVDVTDTGTGTHTLKAYGHVTYVPAAADVDTAGTYKAWITRTISSKDVTFPDDEEGIVVQIVAIP